jgi:hypothetical protein
LGAINAINLSHARQQSVLLLHTPGHKTHQISTEKTRMNKQQNKRRGKNTPGENQGVPKLKNS